MNVELTRRALEKVGNPHILVNIISRRVRQLNSGGGGVSRPLIDAEPGQGVADVALLELIHDKIGYYLEDDGMPAGKPPEVAKRKRRPRAVAPAVAP